MNKPGTITLCSVAAVIFLITAVACWRTYRRNQRLQAQSRDDGQRDCERGDPPDEMTSGAGDGRRPEEWMDDHHHQAEGTSSQSWIGDNGLNSEGEWHRIAIDVENGGMAEYVDRSSMGGRERELESEFMVERDARSPVSGVDARRREGGVFETWRGYRYGHDFMAPLPGRSPSRQPVPVEVEAVSVCVSEGSRVREDMESEDMVSHDGHASPEAQETLMAALPLPPDHPLHPYHHHHQQPQQYYEQPLRYRHASLLPGPLDSRRGRHTPTPSRTQTSIEHLATDAGASSRRASGSEYSMYHHPLKQHPIEQVHNDKSRAANPGVQDDGTGKGHRDWNYSADVKAETSTPRGRQRERADAGLVANTQHHRHYSSLGRYDVRTVDSNSSTTPARWSWSTEDERVAEARRNFEHPSGR